MRGPFRALLLLPWRTGPKAYAFGFSLESRPSLACTSSTSSGLGGTGCPSVLKMVPLLHLQAAPGVSSHSIYPLIWSLEHNKTAPTSVALFTWVYVGLGFPLFLFLSFI